MLYYKEEDFELYLISNKYRCWGWGLGIGDWAQSPIPNPQSPIPQSPIPNPQSPLYFVVCFIFF